MISGKILNNIKLDTIKEDDVDKITDTLEPEYTRKARENREKYGIIEGSPGLVYTTRKTSCLHH